MSATDPQGEPQEERAATSPPPDPITKSVIELRQLTEQLRLIGPAVLLATLCNFGVLLWIIGQSVQWSYDPIRSPLASILLSVGTIAALGWFETLRKRGDAIFQELSDELQWHLGRASATATPRERPFLDARVALRTFSAAAELPLIPGRYGPAIYAALSLLIAIGSVLTI